MGVRFVGLRVWEVRIPFRFSYVHALADRREAASLLLAVTTDTGQTGWGEAVPRTYLTGETLHTARTDLTNLWWPAVREIDVDRYDDLLARLEPVYARADEAGRTAGYAGLELACVDAVGRVLGRPARAAVPASMREADARQSRFVYTGPVGGGTLARAVRYARGFRWLGYREVKLKLGGPDDVERVRAVRAALGPRVDLRVDVNGAWDVATALARAEALRAAEISSVEQPVAASDLHGLARVRRESGVPVMADESLCTRAHARALVQAGACDLFNVRLAKGGGYSGALAMLRAAREAGLACQLGALVGETAVLDAAAEEFLAAVGPQRHHETSFPRVLLRSSPARGARLPRLGGRLSVRPARPGFGVRVDERALARVAQGHWTA